MLHLTDLQLTRALAGLNPTERIELLTLLESRERQEAERPEDTRPLLSSYLEPLTETARAHYERLEVHLQRLQSERPPPDESIRSYLHNHWALWDEAAKLADADGFPAVPPKVAASEPEPDRQPLPLATAHDVEVSRGLERAQRRSAPSEPEPDRLAPFRGIGEWHLPESHHPDD